MPGPSDPTFRKSLTEADLRDVKDDAVGRLAKGAREVAGGMPNVDNIERFVAPIVEKVNRDHDELVRQGVDPNTPKKQDVEGRTAVGEFDFSTGHLAPTVEGAKLLEQRARPESLNTRAIRYVVNQITTVADYAEPWKRLLLKARIQQLPPGHSELYCRGCDGSPICLVRETALRAIVQKWMQRFGDPRPMILAEDKRQRKAARKAARG